MGYPNVWINAKVTDKIGFAVTTGPYQAMPLPTSWQVNLLDKACFGLPPENVLSTRSSWFRVINLALSNMCVAFVCISSVQAIADSEVHSI